MGCETTSNVSTKSLVPTREILLVDDDAGLLEVLPQTIEYHLAQVRVTACDSAEAALRHIHSGHYDLVITDLNMPGMKGLEFAVASKPSAPRQPFSSLPPMVTRRCSGKPYGQGLMVLSESPLIEIKLRSPRRSPPTFFTPSIDPALQQSRNETPMHVTTILTQWLRRS